MISTITILACLFATISNVNCQLYQLAPGSCGCSAPASIPAPCPTLPIVYPNYGCAPLPPAPCGPSTILPFPSLSAPVLMPYPSFAPPCGCNVPVPPPCGCVPVLSPAPCSPPTTLPFPSPSTPVLLPYPSYTPPCGCNAPVPPPCRCQAPFSGLLTEVVVPDLASLSLLNPLLPAASPVSALANPVAPCLPPAIPNGCYNKCVYGKRCPIPPPFL